MKPLLLVACAGAAVAAGEAERLNLPVDWTAGTAHRYRATWSRAIDVWRAPGSPPPSMTGQHRGEVVVRVASKSKDGYVVRWQPTIVGEAAPTAGGDVDAAGAELWRYSLTVPLDIEVGGQGGLEVRNAGEARERLASKFQELLREAGAAPDLDCVGRDATTTACQAVGTEAATSALLVRSASPLFNCAGTDLDVHKAETWSEPHPSPEIGEAVTIDYRREVVGYDARSPRIRFRTVSQPNAAQLQAWMKRQLGTIPARDKDELEPAMDQFTFRFETDCTLDRGTGWPVTVEFKSSGGTALYQGSETVRFERIDP